MKMSLSSVSSTKSNENTTVFVSGSSFCMVPSLYQKVEKLRWQRRRDNTLHLKANADVFEILLRYLMFGKLPEAINMTPRQASELGKMIEPLDNIEPLVEHLAIFLAAEQGKRRAPSFLRRRLSSMSLKSKGSDDETSTTKPLSIAASKDDDGIDVFGHLTEPVQPVQPAARTDDFIGVHDLVDRSAPPVVNVDFLPTLHGTTSVDDSEVSSRTAEHKTFASENVSTSMHISNPHMSPNSFSKDLAHHSSSAEARIRKAISSSESDHSSSSSPSPSPRGVTKSLWTAFQNLKNRNITRRHSELCASEYVM